jgi:hypothetical protein
LPRRNRISKKWSCDDFKRFLGNKYHHLLTTFGSASPVGAENSWLSIQLSYPSTGAAGIGG